MPERAVTLDVIAPVSGVVVPLAAVPDPVFARKMMGDGAAIDPTSAEVLAPVAGTVTQLHEAQHALAVATGDGVEVLVHVGLDTVALGGRGFTALVRKGARVERGQPLLRFDPEILAREARSLLVEVVVTSGARVESMEPARGTVKAGETALLRLALKDAAAAAAAAGEPVLSAPVALPNPAGLHARPAAVVAARAKQFVSDVRLVRGPSEVNAKSVVAIMGLSARRGEPVRVKAVGPDAETAAAELAKLLAEGAGEAPGEAPVPTETAPRLAEVRTAGRGEILGAPASPGLATGKVFQHRHGAFDVAERGGSAEEERARLDRAVREAARQIEALKQHAYDRQRAQILDVHLALLEDPGLVSSIDGLLAEGKSAAFACREAFAGHAAKLERLDNPVLRERAADVRDVGRRLLALLAGVEPAELLVPEGAVLVAEELTPSDMSGFDRRRPAAVCTARGGSTSHVAILARGMGIPAICGIDEAALALPDGIEVVVDGSRGVLRVSPEEGFVSQVRERIARQAAQREVDASTALAPGRTRDGHRVEVAANVRNAREAREAVAAGAEGVGLLRSEFLFEGRATAPSEEEQAASYVAVAEVLGKERPLVVRTLDVGGDKPLPYLPLPREENPFLGMRGIRVSLEHPEMFRAQLRAILRAAPVGNLHVMFPMVATLDEVRAAKEMLAEEQEAVTHSVKVGAMIEVPSAVVIAEVLARELDFFSIGTNDLTQYALAMDRNHPKLAGIADAMNPAVLRMIAMTVEGAHEHGKWVGVCGGIASDPVAVPVLVGLGVDELSVDVPAIPAVKAALARWSMEECAGLASELVRLRTTAEIRGVLAARASEEGEFQGRRIPA